MAPLAGSSRQRCCRQISYHYRARRALGPNRPFKGQRSWGNADRRPISPSRARARAFTCYRRQRFAASRGLAPGNAAPASRPCPYLRLHPTVKPTALAAGSPRLRRSAVYDKARAGGRRRRGALGNGRDRGGSRLGRAPAPAAGAQHRPRGVATGSVNVALRPLRMATKLDRFRPSARIMLEPWLVEAALVRLGDRRLSPEEQAKVVQAVRTPHKVRWPDWWEIKPSRTPS
jgi:hypothetical protein